MYKGAFTGSYFQWEFVSGSAAIAWKKQEVFEWQHDETQKQSEGVKKSGKHADILNGVKIFFEILTECVYNINIYATEK